LVPYQTFISQNHVKDDGLSSCRGIWTTIICTYHYCCEDGEDGGDQVGYGYGNTNCYLYSYYGCKRFSGCGTCCPLRPSTFGSYLRACYIWWTSSGDKGFCASS